MDASVAPEPIYVEQRRGGHSESWHRVLWCVTSPTGAVGGHATTATMARSALKPFQALAALRSGALDRAGLGPVHLACGCGSHGGDAWAVGVVREILTACGVEERALRCGAELPLDPAEARSLIAAGGPVLPVHHNCSGKHALALAACRASGWSLDRYVESEHALQQLVRAAVREHVVNPWAALDVATDGCGIPTLRLTLEQVATAFARLAVSSDPQARQIVRAMRSHPQLVAYPGTPDVELMAALDGAVAKVGGEGVLGLGLPDGRGLALKVADGGTRALGAAAVHAVDVLLGLEVNAPSLAACAHRPVRTAGGEIVGEIVVCQPPPSASQ